MPSSSLMTGRRVADGTEGVVVLGSLDQVEGLVAFEHGAKKVLRKVRFG